MMSEDTNESTVDRTDDRTSTSGYDAPPRESTGEQLRPFLLRVVEHAEDDTPVALLFRILAIAAEPTAIGGIHLFDSAEMLEDFRGDRVHELVVNATPELRTRTIKLASALGPLLKQVRAIILAAKADQNDSDITAGDAEVTPDGWLVVSMAGREIARVPFNPTRPRPEAEAMAEQILTEYVRLHVSSTLEVMAVPSAPQPTTDDAGAVTSRVVVPS